MFSLARVQVPPMLLTDFYNGMSPADVPLYAVAEAAHCLHLAPSTVRSWIKPIALRRNLGSVILPALIGMADRMGKRLSFNNLVELHVLSTIRLTTGLSMPRVRASLDYLSKLFGTDRPLLDVEMQTNGVALFVEHDGDLLDASSPGQVAMRAVLAQFLQRIERDAAGRPRRLFPFVARDQREQSPMVITIDPWVRFGRPCIVGTNLPTSIIAERHRAGDSVEDLAFDYDRPPSDIEQAIRYERRSAA